MELFFHGQWIAPNDAATTTTTSHNMAANGCPGKDVLMAISAQL